MNVKKKQTGIQGGQTLKIEDIKKEFSEIRNDFSEVKKHVI